MEAGDTCVADLVDTCTMKWTAQFVITVFTNLYVIGSNRITRPREGSCWLIHKMSLHVWH